MSLFADDRMEVMPHFADQYNKVSLTNIAAVLLPSIPMATQSKPWGCGSAIVEIAGSSPEEAMDVCRL